MPRVCCLGPALCLPACLGVACLGVEMRGAALALCPCPATLCVRRGPPAGLPSQVEGEVVTVEFDNRGCDCEWSLFWITPQGERRQHGRLDAQDRPASPD